MFSCDNITAFDFDVVPDVNNNMFIAFLSILVDIYSLFPYYYADTSNFKKKGYCNPLYRVGAESKLSREIFSAIYSYLSGGQEKFVKFPTTPHPLDRSGQHKWEISPR